MSVVRDSQTVFAGLESLEQRQLLAATPLAVTTVRETEPNDRFVDANSVVLPTSGGLKLRGRFQSEGDRDVFTFTATQGGTVLVELVPRLAAVPRLKVKIPGGRRVLRIEPNVDEKFGQFRVEAGQTYAIQFDKNVPVGSNKYEVQFRYRQSRSRSRDGGHTRDRRARVNPGPVQQIVESELNNSKASADAFTLPTVDTVSVLSGVSNNTRDRDYFSFRAPRDGEMRFAIKSLNGRQMFLKVVDKNGTLVDEIETNTNGRNANFSGIVDKGQTYFVLARARVFKRSFYQMNVRYTETL